MTEEINSLEQTCLDYVLDGIGCTKQGEPSEALKAAQDLVMQIMCIQALRETVEMKIDRSTGLSYEGWNEQKACLALGISHKQLRAAIKRFELVEPAPEPQPDLFEDAA